MAQAKAQLEMQSSVGFPQAFQVDWKMYDAQPRHAIQLPANLTELLTHPAYSVLFECLLPSLKKKYRAFPGESEPHIYLVDASVPGTAVHVQGKRATVIGNQEYVKTHLLQSIEWYERFGLTMADYRVAFDETGAILRFGEMCFSSEI